MIPRLGVSHCIENKLDRQSNPPLNNVWEKLKKLKKFERVTMVPRTNEKFDVDYEYKIKQNKNHPHFMTRSRHAARVKTLRSQVPWSFKIRSTGDQFKLPLVCYVLTSFGDWFLLLHHNTFPSPSRSSNYLQTCLLIHSFCERTDNAVSCYSGRRLRFLKCWFFFFFVMSS